MAEAHLDRLHLDVDRARSAADFFESYANTAGRDLENAVQVASVLREGGELSDELDIQWVLTMEAASALREAASWAVFFDVGRAFTLLQRSGFLYQTAGLAFGSFLLTIAGSSAADELHRDATLLAELHGVSGDSGLIEVPNALYHPQQQAYLLLACAGMADNILTSRRLTVPREVLESQRSLRAIASESPNRLGVLPFGSLGTPVRVVWDIGTRLLEPRGENPESLGVVARHLAGLCGRYSDMMNLASVNEYLWENGAAPVDVGDIEIIGITALCVSHFGSDELTHAVLRNGLDSASVSFVPFDLGREMAERQG
jgi:hypothetical protein